MSPANIKVKLFSWNWTFTFRKVVQQQISGEVLILIPPSSRSFLNLTVKILWKLVNFAEFIDKNNSGLIFSLRHWVE